MPRPLQMGVAALIVAPHRARVRLLIEFPHQLGYSDRPRSVGDEPCPVTYPDDALRVHVDRLGQGRLQIATNLLLVMSTPGDVPVSRFRPTRPDPTSTEPVYAIIG